VSASDDREEARGRLGDLDPVAVIDIGSNSVRLVVYEGAVRSPTPLFNEKVLCGLGRSVATTGRLGADAVQRALAALARFRAITGILRVSTVHAIATAAVRDADNGPEFIAAGERACGVPIQVLSGEREAELAAAGIFMGFPRPNGIAGDLGGGSLELIDIESDRRRAAVTLPLGGLRLIDTSGARLDRALDQTDASLRAVDWLPRGAGRTFYAVGGTWRSLARLHMEMNAYPLRVMHGYRLEQREAIDFCERLRKAKKLGDLPGIAGISKPRREVLPYGAMVLEGVLRRMQARDVVFSVYGIREGLLFSLLSDAERAKDPLLSFALDYARLRSRSAEHARELCAWTDTLFREPGPKESEEERRLRHAACLLSDIGWRAHPDYRGEQSLNVIANAGLGGIDHEGRVFLALTVYYRHTGSGADDDDGRQGFSERLKSIASKRTIRRARILGAAIRTAHMLSIGMAGVIGSTPLRYDGDRLILTLPPAYRVLDGERLGRRLEALARLLDRRSEIWHSL
jgi:exopolyphosphatase/guanosine-5'-triphosphate,3'-diphosphate pyrophosphatase